MINIASLLTENRGVISGAVGSEISIAASNSYIYYKVPCDALKHFCVFTREEKNNPNYIIETDAANVVTKVHTNNANTTPYYVRRAAERLSDNPSYWTFIQRVKKYRPSLKTRLEQAKRRRAEA